VINREGWVIWGEKIDKTTYHVFLWFCSLDIGLYIYKNYINLTLFLRDNNGLILIGEATVGVDYQAVGSTRVRWRPEEVDPNPNDAPFAVTILNDDVPEETEYFEVFFRVDVNGHAFPGIARVTILDDDIRAGKNYSHRYRTSR